MELKACPKCNYGGKPVPENKGTEKRPWWMIVCGMCGWNDAFHFDTEALAVEYWNRRPIEDRLRAENEKQKALLKDAYNYLDSFGYIEDGEKGGVLDRWFEKYHALTKDSTNG